MNRDLPEGVVDADPPGGWEEVDDGEAAERDAAAAQSQEGMPAPPDDPGEGEEARRGVDPDLNADEGGKRR